jgi:quercetin dioxygenase-like cupin family protein
MSFVEVHTLPEVERKPGWRGRYFDSPSMTFAHYEFDAGSSIHEHFHPGGSVDVIEGELEITIGGMTRRVGAGGVGIVLPARPFRPGLLNPRAIGHSHRVRIPD